MGVDRSPPSGVEARGLECTSGSEKWEGGGGPQAQIVDLRPDRFGENPAQ